MACAANVYNVVCFVGVAGNVYYGVCFMDLAGVCSWRRKMACVCV